MEIDPTEEQGMNTASRNITHIKHGQDNLNSKLKLSNTSNFNFRRLHEFKTADLQINHLVGSSTKFQKNKHSDMFGLRPSEAQEQTIRLRSFL